MKQHRIEVKEGFWGKWKFLMTVKDKSAGEWMLKFLRANETNSKKYYRYKFK